MIEFVKSRLYTRMAVIGDIHGIEFVVIAEDEFRVVCVMCRSRIDADRRLKPSSAFLVWIHPCVGI